MQVSKIWFSIEKMVSLSTGHARPMCLSHRGEEDQYGTSEIAPKFALMTLS